MHQYNLQQSQAANHEQLFHQQTALPRNQKKRREANQSVLDYCMYENKYQSSHDVDDQKFGNPFQFNSQAQHNRDAAHIDFTNDQSTRQAINDFNNTINSVGSMDLYRPMPTRDFMKDYFENKSSTTNRSLQQYQFATKSQNARNPHFDFYEIQSQSSQSTQNPNQVQDFRPTGTSDPSWLFSGSESPTSGSGDYTSMF